MTSRSHGKNHADVTSPATVANLVKLAGVALAGVLLAAPAARAADGDPKLPCERYQLPNGLEVILHKDNTVPLAYVSVWYHVASGDEVPGKSGFAHLFEHMMFQGSVHVGEDKHFSTLEKIGASNINGTTSTDRTSYYEEIPSNQLETALWLESDRMGYLLPLLTQKSFDNQREVVRNERRQRVDNVPYGKSRAVQSQMLYGEGHPYRHMVIGRHEDLVAASVDDVKSFFRKWYAPANATLLIAGDIDVAQTKQLVDKWFGSFPKAAKPVHLEVPPTPITATKRQIVTDDFAKLRRINYAWHTPRAFSPGDSEFDILGSVLGRSGTGRLYKILVHEKQWAQNVQVYEQSQGHSSIFQVVVDLKPDADLKAVEEVLDAELERVRTEPISERERQRVITEIEAGFLRSLEGLSARGELLQEYNHFYGDPNSLSRHLDSFRSAKAEGIRAYAAQYLGKDKRAEIIVMPATPAGKPGAPPQKAGVSLAPAAPKGAN
jgi:zinc protease